jgi:DNA-binding NtrC family response regulator
LSTNKLLVSIVDDELDITVLFSEVLKTIGGTSISTFTDPILALEHFTINKANYVLVISDLKMLGLNGMELLKKVKKLNPSVRTILMTAFEIDDKLLQQYLKCEIINAFLQKPIEIKDFLLEVHKQIDNHELQKQRSFIKIK